MKNKHYLSRISLMLLPLVMASCSTAVPGKLDLFYPNNKFTVMCGFDLKGFKAINDFEQTLNNLKTNLHDETTYNSVEIKSFKETYAISDDFSRVGRAYKRSTIYYDANNYLAHEEWSEDGLFKDPIRLDVGATYEGNVIHYWQKTYDTCNVFDWENTYISGKYDISITQGKYNNLVKDNHLTVNAKDTLKNMWRPIFFVRDEYTLLSNNDDQYLYKDNELVGYHLGATTANATATQQYTEYYTYNVSKPDNSLPSGLTEFSEAQFQNLPIYKALNK